jgi:hypothetical protein
VVADEGRVDADGVMVISAWTEGAGGRLLVRLTMSGAHAEPHVIVLASVDEVVDAVSVWFDKLCRSAGVE